MVRTGTWECIRDVPVRSKSGSWGDTPRQGAPKRVTLYAGKHDGRQHRSFLNFDWDFTDIGTLRKAWLVLHTSHADFGKPPGTHVRVFRLTEGFTEKTTDTSFTVDADVNPAFASGTTFYGTFDNDLDAESRIDITSLVGRFLPESKQYIDSANKPHSGGGQGKDGIVVFAKDQDARDHRITFHSDEADEIPLRPVIEFEYDPPNYKPDQVSGIQPDGTVPKTQPFVGEFTDPNGDQPQYIEIDVHKVSGDHVDGSHDGTDKYRFDPTWTEFGGIWTWTIPPLGTDKIKTGTQYEYKWRARGWDPGGLVSDWSDWVEFKRSGTGPGLTTVTHMATMGTLQGFSFEATWTVESGESIVSCRLRLRRAGDPWSLALWDETFAPMTDYERQHTRIHREYGGPTLEPDAYVWQAQVTDSQGLSVFSDERDLTLSVGSEADNDDGTGQPLNVTGYARARSLTRVVLRAADGADRAPGTTVGIIEDPTNLGFRTVVNAPGEMYFTLPASHPQAGVCEPWQTHYIVQQYRNGGWVDLANGWLTDFDAGENDIIIFGLDYLGALAKSIDPRFPGKDVDSDATHDKGGAKYNKETIRYIIRDQLQEAKEAPDSNVGFIAEGNIDSMGTTEITIYSAFKERLDFIRGLIQSHKAGTGLRTRLRARWDPAGHQWVWDLRNTTGKDRDNLRLEYGSLLQNFRVVAMGADFSTKVHAIGTEPNHVKPRYAIYPGSSGDFWTDTFGLTQTVLTLTDISDENDLKRRVKQARAEAARVGKQVWVAVRVHAIDPLDGYDLMDSIPLAIDRGMVETDRYGSGYWTIHGTEWRLFPDGHDELSLIIRPREDESTPDPDLLPSDPVHDDPEWALGVGEPVPSVEFMPNSEYYYDTSTNTLYQRTDPDDPEYWEEVANMSGGGSGGGPPAPGAPTLLTADDDVVIQPDGTVVTSLVATWLAPAEGEVDHYEIQLGYDDLFARLRSLTTPALEIRITPVAPFVPLWVRVRAFGRYSTAAPWSNVLPVTPGSDPFSPDVPSDLSATPGYKLVGLSWPRATHADLGRYGVRWTNDLPSGGPNVDNWVNTSTLSNMLIVQHLDPSMLYWFQVRAIDRSNQTQTSIADSTSVDADQNPDAGWSLAVSAQPLKIGTSDIAVDEAVIGFLSSGEIDASMITSGVLTVGKTGISPSIEVKNENGDLLGRWDEDGILVVDPDRRGRAVWIAAGNVAVTDAYDDAYPVTDVDHQHWTNSVTAEGINASAIAYGINPGGHNNLPNAGFELTAFAQSLSKVWTSAADWATAASPVNIDTTAVDLRLTTYVF